MTLPSWITGVKDSDSYANYRKPLTVAVDRERPDIERLVDVIGSKTKRDLKFNRALSHKKGALAWIKQQGKDRYGKQKYYLYDDDLDGDGIPEIAIRDKNDNLYSLNGYRTIKSDFIFQEAYLDAHPTRKSRKEEPFDVWLEKQLKVQKKDKYGLENKWDENNKLYARAKAAGYKTHVQENVSPLRAFTKYVVVPVIHNSLESLYSDNEQHCKKYITDPKNPDFQAIAARKYAGLLPTATAAIANKVFNQMVNAPLLSMYTMELKDVIDKIIDKAKKENYAPPEGVELQKQAVKRLTAKKGFKEAQAMLYKHYVDEPATITQAIVNVFNEAVTAKDSKPFQNIWGETVRVNRHQSARASALEGEWKDDDWNEFIVKRNNAEHNKGIKRKYKHAYDFVNEIDDEDDDDEEEAVNDDDDDEPPPPQQQKQLPAKPNVKHSRSPAKKSKKNNKQ